MASEKYDTDMANGISYVTNLKMIAGHVEMHFITISFDTWNAFFKKIGSAKGSEFEEIV